MVREILVPVEEAKKIHRKIGWNEPSDFSLDEIALSMNILIKESPIEGSEGRILIYNDSAILTLSSAINYIPKRNFIIAHEIGHFILHKNICPVFADNEKTISEWFKNGPHEQQANQFAAELLMPSKLFKQKLGKRKLNLSLIKELSSYFNVSLTAAFLRYVSEGEYPLLVIYVENGIIKWFKQSNDFPFKYIEKDSKVPVLTVSGDLYFRNQFEEDPEKVDAIQWFPNDYFLQKHPETLIWEQCYPVTKNSFVTCIWTN